MKTKNGVFAPTASACLQNVLSRLDKVKSVGANKWKACCPAHDDKSPSLAISETSDGTVLVRCWVGCSAKAIVEAVGLDLRHLFPNGLRERAGPSKAAINYERTVYLVGAAQLQNGTLAGEDLARFKLAKKRLGVA
jgi:hypothetical protein